MSSNNPYIKIERDRKTDQPKIYTSKMDDPDDWMVAISYVIEAYLKYSPGVTKEQAMRELNELVIPQEPFEFDS